MKQIFLTLVAAVVAQQISGSESKDCKTDYTVQRGDSLSSILFANGIGTAESKFKIYGKNNWAEKNIAENKLVSDWQDLTVGTRLRLLLPCELLAPQPKVEPSSAPEVKPAEVLTPESFHQKSEAPIDPQDLIGKLSFSYAHSITVDETGYFAKLNRLAASYEAPAYRFKKLRFHVEAQIPFKHSTDNFQYRARDMFFFVEREFQWLQGNERFIFSLVPQLGLWNYEYVMPRADGERFIPVFFRAKNLPSLGLAVSETYSLHRYFAKIQISRHQTLNQGFSGQAHRDGSLSYRGLVSVGRRWNILEVLTFFRYENCDFAHAFNDRQNSSIPAREYDFLNLTVFSFGIGIQFDLGDFKI